MGGPTVTHALGSSWALGQDLSGDTLPFWGSQGKPQHHSVCPSCISGRKTIMNLMS